MIPTASAAHGSGGGRTPVTYAHSPYSYRSNIEIAPAHGVTTEERRSTPRMTTATASSSAPQYSSPLIASHGSFASSPVISSVYADPFHGTTNGVGLSSTPIQVGSGPTVHARYRRSVQSPTLRTATENPRGFPSSPTHSLPPPSPFSKRDDVSFQCGESAPVRCSSYSYRSGTPQNTSDSYGAPTTNSNTAAAMSLSGASGHISPHQSLRGGTAAIPLSRYGGATSPAHSTSGGGGGYAVNGASSGTYAPAGFTMPPPMGPSSVGGVSSYHPSPLMSRSAGGASAFQSREPTSPTRYVFDQTTYSSGGAAPLLAAVQRTQSSANGGGATDGAESQRKSKRGGVQDDASSSSKSSSSIREDLPLCTNDDGCTLINDRKHQRKFAHTCRLFPCYHGHVTRHAKLFRHTAGQIAQPEGVTTPAKMSRQALTSVNFSTISPEAPNAYRIYVSHGEKSYEIFGDWASVKVHTFKRYLHQVYHIPPSSQVLSVLKSGKVMDDDINTVKCYGIEEDAVILLRNSMEKDSEVLNDSGSIKGGIALKDL